jgi:hypothetical protein
LIKNQHSESIADNSTDINLDSRFNNKSIFKPGIISPNIILDENTVINELEEFYPISRQSSQHFSEAEGCVVGVGNINNCELDKSKASETVYDTPINGDPDNVSSHKGNLVIVPSSESENNNDISISEINAIFNKALRKFISNNQVSECETADRVDNNLIVDNSENKVTNDSIELRDIDISFFKENFKQIYVKVSISFNKRIKTRVLKIVILDIYSNYKISRPTFKRSGMQN